MTTARNCDKKKKKKNLINPSEFRSLTSVCIKMSDYLGLKVRPILRQNKP